MVKVLWVDDQKQICELGVLKVRSLGHSAESAQSGEEALRMLAEESFDLVITDVGMPGMNGWMLCDRIRQMSGNEIKIAVLSGWGKEQLQQEIDDHNPDYLLSKPFTLDQLKELLESAANGE